MRLFVCTWLDADNQAFYSRRMAEIIERSGGRLRAVPPGSAHVTHAFLPRVDNREWPDVVRAVRDAAARHAAVSIRLGPQAILFARAEARLVYAPIVHGADPVMQLGADIVAELRRGVGGIEVSGSRSPHVTLARFRQQTRRADVRSVSDALDRGSAAVERNDRVAEVQIVSSELTASAPTYVTRERMPLR